MTLRVNLLGDFGATQRGQGGRLAGYEDCDTLLPKQQNPFFWHETLNRASVHPDK